MQTKNKQIKINTVSILDLLPNKNKLKMIVAIFLPSIFAATNLIVNGGFENAVSHEQSCGAWCHSSNALLIAPWTFSGQSSYELNFGVWPAYGGKVSMDLSSTGPVTISQVVPTTLGKRYVVSFQLNDNSCNSPETYRTGSIVATGATPLSFGHKGGFQSPNPSNWTEVKYYFFATRAMTTVSISSTDASSCGNPNPLISI